MSANLPDALAEKATVADVRMLAEWLPWAETALTAFLAAAAVVFVSFLSVTTNL
jgi:hypothetical protein